MHRWSLRSWSSLTKLSSADHWNKSATCCFWLWLINLTWRCEGITETSLSNDFLQWRLLRLNVAKVSGPSVAIFQVLSDNFSKPRNTTVAGERSGSRSRCSSGPPRSCPIGVFSISRHNPSIAALSFASQTNVPVLSTAIRKHAGG
jgi:hypothetical protein